MIDINRINKVSRRDDISSIYCLKTLGAFFVICIHCAAPWYFYPLIRTAVPFFFIISGYFLYSTDRSRGIEKCIRAFKKVFWLTLYANIFYYLGYYIPNDYMPIRDIKALFQFVFIGGSCVHLWYLNAYLEALFIIGISLKFNKLKLLWICSPLFWIFGLMTGGYQFLFPFVPNHYFLTRNF